MVSIRPAAVGDIPAIAQIHKHYVLNTSITFTETPLSHDAHVAAFDDITSQRLPYIVAVDSDQVVGYANAHAFRGAKGAYRHTVEITLFCDPAHTAKGIGPKLLNGLLDALRKGPLVKEVLAVMAIDPAGKRGGVALRDWYIRNGFELVGHLRRVGYKFDKWYVFPKLRRR